MFYSTLVDPVVHVPAARPVAHREPRPLIANQSAWDEVYEKLGCKTRADRKRADLKLTGDLLSTRVGDRKILTLLQALAYRCPKTPTRDKLLVCVQSALASIRVRKIRDVPTEIVGTDELMELMTLPGPDLSQEGLNEKSFWDYQLVKLLSKYPFAGYDQKASQNALDSFMEEDLVTAQVNSRIRDWDQNHELCNELREVVRVILGRPPTPQEVLEMGTWGPGTCAGYPFRSAETGAEMKFNAQLSMTPGALPMAHAILPHFSVWYRHLTSVYGQQWSSLVPGNTLQTVPKKFLLDRTIAGEPLWNSWLQAMIGAVMRKRFKRFGWDLDTCWEINQALAREGSMHGDCATLDMKNASNRIAFELVRAVLPESWFAFLNAGRCAKMLLPPYLACKYRSPHTLAMFSSMGNGYTFELESLLFMAVALVASHRKPTMFRSEDDWLKNRISVYGDDVLLPTQAASGFQEICQEIGMEVNVQKSFVRGPFRESCGLDSYGGVTVRPLLITRRVENGFDLITLANRIRSFAHRLHDEPGYTGLASSRWAGMWSLAHSWIPADLRRVLATPPFVEGGLWSTMGESFSCDLDPRNTVYRVIAEKSSSLSMGSEVFSFRGEGVSSMWTGNGDNLLAARIGPSAKPVESWRKPTYSSMQKLLDRVTGIKESTSKADRSDLRFTPISRISLSRVARHSSWLGWGSLFSDFS